MPSATAPMSLLNATITTSAITTATGTTSISQSISVAPTREPQLASGRPSHPCAPGIGWSHPPEGVSPAGMGS
jgi:hypothetical protein